MATESDKINVAAVATLIAVLALALVAIVAVLTAMVRGEVTQEVARKGGTSSTREVRDLIAQQQSELTAEAQWVDRDAGVLSIPVERSMFLVVEDIRRDPELATTAALDAGAADASDDAEPTTADAEPTTADAEPATKQLAPPAAPSIPPAPVALPIPEPASPPATPAPTHATPPTPAPTVSSDAQR